MRHSSAEEVEILLVEDNPDDVEMALRALYSENLSNRVHVARDGEDALDFLLCRKAHEGRNPENQPKLILLDLKLPGVDGFQVLETIKNNSRTKALPVVVVSSSRQEQDVDRAYALGANSYVQKPAAFDQFHSTIQQVVLYWLVANRLPLTNGIDLADWRQPG